MFLLLLKISIGLPNCLGYDNLSLNRPAVQTSTWTCIPGENCDKYKAGNAVDGNDFTCARSKSISTTHLIHKVMWHVDLGSIYNIYRVTIQYRNYEKKYEQRQKGRFAGFSLYLSNTTKMEDGLLCYKNSRELLPLNFTVYCMQLGKYIIYYNERLSGIVYPSHYENTTLIDLCEVSVEGCKEEGVYGSNCNMSCPDKCQGKTCNIINGTCFECRPGWMGSFCNKPCESGSYGIGCKSHCSGHCADDATCNNVYGYCKSGCIEGWEGEKCDQACARGKYGANCALNCSENCREADFCNRFTGNCSTGCKIGYTGPLCNEVCRNGTYGAACSLQCKWHCADNDICNNVDGHCENGCTAGWEGEQCEKVCDRGKYGANCTFNCSENCLDTENCDRFDGECSAGCKTGYTGPLCDIVTVAEKGNYTQLLGVCIGAGTIFLTLLISGIFLLRMKSKSRTKLRLIDNEESIELQTIAQRRNTIRNRRTILCESIRNERDDHPLSTVDPFSNDRRGSLSRLNKIISTKDLQKVIAKMSKYENAGFKREYRQITKGKLFPYIEARRPENIEKNRFKAIYPYDHSRVVLETALPNESDYINANFIEDAQEEISYIATQGPKEKTVYDFWSMVWQEYVRVIVCLTTLSDGVKIKCAQYWPDTNKIMKIGHFTIRTKNEKVYANYTIRRIYVKKGQKELMVMMCHYTQWSDHDILEPLCLVTFHRHVLKISESYLGNFILVHCSAGIGRTGTFIALDALYREGLKSGKVNVPKYVETMRRNRMNMVQVWEQYKIVYLALYESFKGISKCKTPNEFLKEHQEQTIYANCGRNLSDAPLFSEFEELIRLRNRYTSDDILTGLGSIDENDTAPVLPLKKYACQLANVKDRETHCNAVVLQSFTSSDSLISAQYPLPDYTEDFLRLLKDFSVYIVIFTCPLKDVSSSTRWFPFNGKNKTVGSFKIKLTDSTSSTNLTIRDIVLQSKGCPDMNLKVIECTSWTEKLSSSNRKVLLDVVNEIGYENIRSDSKLLVLSSDGAKRCGPFCVVYNAVQQISLDREVDIFVITRLLQLRRPEFISTWEEYEFCNDVLADFIQNGLVYANSRYRSIRNTLISFIR